jgi:23S rRNA pseudouridine1911/1915/1917 synthase
MNDDSKTEILSEPVPDCLAGKRLDQALARMFPQYSRSKLKNWVMQGQVTVDGDLMRPRDAVSSGSMVILRPLSEVAVFSLPEPMELQIAYEDDDLLVTIKPAGLVVHPGAGNHRGTLMNGLLAYAPQLEALPRAGIVHRLDKDTSGLLLVGKSLAAYTALVRQLAAREISRHYLAVCNGVLTGGGTIDEPIARHPVDRLRMHVSDRGKQAVTHYRVLQRFAAHTYISVQLETGRTHQIRVHFAHRRHPLLGDQTYGGRLAIPAGASGDVVELLRCFRRQALHAEKLSFAHPVSGEPVCLQADPPADFMGMLDVLKRDP